MVTSLRVRPGAKERAQDELLTITGRIRANPGCNDFHVYRDREDPGRFVVYEDWVDGEAFEAHLGGEYMVRFLSVAGELFASRESSSLQRLSH